MAGAGVIVGFVSQKGGVGKSTLARALGAVVAFAGLKTKIADLDAYQQTVLEWERRRDKTGDETPIRVQAFETAAEAIASAEDDELLIIDAPAHASRATLEIAKAAVLIVQPSGGSLDDLRPAVLLFHELVKAGVPKERLVFALCRILSQSEEETARAYLTEAGYGVFPGCIPETSVYRQAQNRGQAITEATGKAITARTDKLMMALLQRVRVALKERGTSQKTGSGTRKQAS